MNSRNICYNVYKLPKHVVRINLKIEEFLHKENRLYHNSNFKAYIHNHIQFVNKILKLE